MPASGRSAPLTEPLPCPLCEYDLRGLNEPRCPECGYRYTWGELDDPARRFHPYLFEHHPEANAWSFGKTLLAGLRPSDFWNTLHPTQPSRLRRLMGYWMLTALPLLALAAIHIGLLVDAVLARLRGGSHHWVVVLRWAGNYDSEGGRYGLVALMCVAWPWLTLAALLLFQVSLRRARLRTTHVLRAVVYCSDICLWIVPPLALLVWTTWAASGTAPRAFFPALSAALPLVVFAFLVYRLHAAYEHYLRFDHALATVLSSQAIVSLLYWKLWLMAEGY